MYRINIWHHCPPPRWTGEKGILPATHTPPGPAPAARRQRPDWSCGLISAETARSSISIFFLYKAIRKERKRETDRQRTTHVNDEMPFAGRLTGVLHLLNCQILEHFWILWCP